MRRLRLTISYDGTGFHGWQVQPGLPTVQGTLEQVLAEIEGAPVDVAGSGRTDAGVHAIEQVAAATLRNPIPPDNLRRAMNRLLPPAIRVLHVEETHLAFHPRFDAIAKTYEYRIVRSEICSPLEWRYVYHYPYPIDTPLLIAAATLLEGEHDFTCFAAADEKDSLGHSKIRTIYSSTAWLDGERLIYRVRGSGFLKHMVRNIVGTLLEVGKGNLDDSGLRQLLTAASRVNTGRTAPAKGLFLVSVEYRGAAGHL